MNQQQNCQKRKEDEIICDILLLMLLDPLYNYMIFSLLNSNMSIIDKIMFVLKQVLL
jgi:hypothetical protein